MSDPDSPLAHDPIPDQSPPPRPLPSSAPATSKSSRRLPPPCWTPEETIALIDGYREKWYALNRENLKANHWEEVAGAVAATCPEVTPRKTAVQCRHKMEKLRQRYRTEIQRARSVPVARFVSSWVHYKRMEAMESKADDDEEKDDATPRFFNRNGGGGGGGIRIRIPRAGRVGTGKRGREMMMCDDDDSVSEIAGAIKLLGDTMLRIEEKKMEMTREIEGMRMEMEMKRTKMVLESQQRIVEAFAETMSENLKKRKARREA